MKWFKLFGKERKIELFKNTPSQYSWKHPIEKISCFLHQVIFIAIDKDNETFIRSAALTYYSLMGLIPLLGATIYLLFHILSQDMINSIFAIWGIEEYANAFVGSNSSQSSTISQNIISSISNYQERASQHNLLGLGVVFVSHILLFFNDLQNSFCRIWSLEKRAYHKKIIWGILFYLGSLLIFAFITIVNKYLSFIPDSCYLYLTAGILLALFYKYVAPEVETSWEAAISAVLICIIFWIIVRLFGGIIFDSKIKDYIAIYGYLAPMFILLVWIYVFWGICIIGANICASIDNVDKFYLQQQCQELSLYTKMHILLLICAYIYKNYSGKPITEKEIRKNLFTVSKESNTSTSLPYPFIVECLNLLVAKGIVKRLKTKKWMRITYPTYEPSLEADSFTIDTFWAKIIFYGNEQLNYNYLYFPKPFKEEDIFQFIAKYEKCIVKEICLEAEPQKVQITRSTYEAYEEYKNRKNYSDVTAFLKGKLGKLFPIGSLKK